MSALLENLDQRLERSEHDVKISKHGIARARARARAILAGDDFAKGVSDRQKQSEAFEQHRQQQLAKLARKSEEMH